MATANPFHLLGDDENDDPSQLIATQKLKIAAKKNTNAAAPAPAAKLPSKPAPPAQAVREARSGGAGRGWPSSGRGGGGGRAGSGGEDGDTAKPFERERNFNKERGGHGGRQESFRGGWHGGYKNGEAGGDSDQPPRRTYERRSGTGRGHGIKREGAGRGNWGTATDGGVEQETEDNVNIQGNVVTEKQSEQEDAAMNKENMEEDKEMTLDEYEKIRNEKRKALLAMKIESRKVDFDKEFESMQQLSIKKGNDDIFLKLGTDKDVNRKKESADQEERSRRVVSINEFLKPVEGERYYSPGGRGRGRGRERGDHGTSRGGFGSGVASSQAAPSFEDPSQFPTLSGK